MLRVEVALPLQDRHHNSVDPASLLSIIYEINDKCDGYRLSFDDFGFWKSKTGEPFPEPTWLLVTDTSFENAIWFRMKKSEWQKKLNQESMYLSIHLVEWI